MSNTNRTRLDRVKDVAGNIAGYVLAWGALYALGLAILALAATLVRIIIDLGGEAPLLYVVAAVLAAAKLVQITIKRQGDR